jgi:opacity protein-like surface antigen
MKAQLVVLGLAAVFLAPSNAIAQRRMPHAGAGSVGAEVGVLLPKDDAMKSGPMIGGFYEHYLTSRDSLRVGAEWQNPKVEAEDSDSVRQVRIGGDLIHNWEGGSVHPFLGAGLAAYILQPRDNGNNFGDSMTRLGGTLLAGAEFFASKTVSVKGEARYNVVAKVSDWNDYNPSGLALTIGVKSYF